MIFNRGTSPTPIFLKGVGAAKRTGYFFGARSEMIPARRGIISLASLENKNYKNYGRKNIRRQIFLKFSN
jgi:hypothetical protein